VVSAVRAGPDAASAARGSLSQGARAELEEAVKDLARTLVTMEIKKCVRVKDFARTRRSWRRSNRTRIGGADQEQVLVRTVDGSQMTVRTIDRVYLDSEALWADRLFG